MKMIARLVVALAVLTQPLTLTFPVCAGTYQARCSKSRECTVRILGDRLIVDNKVIPIDAVTSWAKGGPGSQSNQILGVGATLLFGAPGLLAFGIRSYKSDFSITYYTPEGNLAQILFGFDNGDASRFFETEIQAATGMPIGKVRREAKDFKWKESDYLNYR